MSLSLEASRRDVTVHTTFVEEQVLPDTGVKSTEAVLVDGIHFKVDTGNGLMEVTSTREERYASQVEDARLRVEERRAYFKLARRTHIAERTQTSSMDGLPKLEDNQPYAKVSVDGYQPHQNLLTHLVVSRGEDRPDGTAKVRYIRGRMNPSMIRRVRR
jgi:hypothetical protein